MHHLLHILTCFNMFQQVLTCFRRGFIAVVKIGQKKNILKREWKHILLLIPKNKKKKIWYRQSAFLWYVSFNKGLMVVTEK